MSFNSFKSFHEFLDLFALGKRDFSGMYLQDVNDELHSPLNLCDRDLSNIILDRSYSIRVNFQNANLSDASLISALCRNADFRNANLNRANLKKANLSGAKFNRTHLKKVNLRYTNLVEAKFIQANLSECDLGYALFYGNECWDEYEVRRIQTEQYKPIYTRHQANFTLAELNDCNLFKAQMAYANFTLASFKNTNLTKANLTNTNFAGADLRGAIIDNVEVASANLRGTKIDNNISNEKFLLVWEIVNQGAVSRDLQGVDLSNTDLANTDLRNVNLTGANLSGTNLIRANLENANLSGANLQQAILHDANLRGVTLEGADLTQTELEFSSVLDICQSISDSTKSKVSSVSKLNSDLELVDKLRSLTKDKLYPSEGDYPIDVFFWNTEEEGEFTLENFLVKFNHLKPIKLDKFWQNIPQSEPSLEQEYIRLYQNTIKPIEQYLNNLEVYKLFTPALYEYCHVELYILVAKTKLGDWLTISLKLSSYLEQDELHDSSTSIIKDIAITKLEYRELIITLEETIEKNKKNFPQRNYGGQYINDLTWNLATDRDVAIRNALATTRHFIMGECCLTNLFRGTEDTLLNEHLINKKIYYVGTAHVDIYLLGQTANKNFISMHTAVSWT